jgi:Domain of unknown function (DUF4276)
MIWLEVLVEGASDSPVIKEVLVRKFQLEEGTHFRIHPHKGKGKLPKNLLSKPDLKHQGLLDQLPAKLRGFGKALSADDWVLVVIDSDDQPPISLLNELSSMLSSLPSKPNVMFGLATEETESWFIADINALKKAYPNKVDTGSLKNIQPDAIVGAWEKLARALGVDINMVSGKTKFDWATNIAPHLNLDSPMSPSFKILIENISSIVDLKP